MSRPMPTRSGQRQQWRANYEAISRAILQGQLPPGVQHNNSHEHMGSMSSSDYSALRRKQVTDLVNIEKNYESLLLSETRFPKADETNGEVRSWVELAMENRRILCGSSWSDEELGPGGKNAVGRRTLDILYRAATKTFHSTQILRHLFTIHTFLGEFYLAFKAFDTYIEIISKGRARLEKSGEIDESLDDDETAVRLAAEAIRISCRLGSVKSAEGALRTGVMLQQWIEQNAPDAMPKNSTVEHEYEAAEQTSHLSRETVSLAYYAIGLSQANWALIHYDPQTRAEFQQTAAQTLRRSIEVGSSSNESPETLFALGCILADMKDVAGATDVVRRALQTVGTTYISSGPDGVLSGSEGTSVSHPGSFIKERKLIAVWHLLGLLLSTEDEYEKAEACCEAAFEQFQDPVNLFGLNAESRAKRASVMNGEAENLSERGIVDDMDDFEKQNIIELKMTHMALLNESEGPEVALNESDELIGLYLRLYGNIHYGSVTGHQSRLTNVAPTSSLGAQPRTFDGIGSTDRQASKEHQAAQSGPTAIHHHTNAGRNPTIEITNEKGTPTQGSHHHFLGHRHEGEEKHRHFGSLRSKAFGSVRKGKASSESQRTVYNEKEAALEGTTHAQHSAGQRLDGVSHNMTPETHHSPAPRFLALQQIRHRVSVLIKVWLYIANLYIEASMAHDAKEAIQEAYSLIEHLETEVSKKDSSVKAFQERQWGDIGSVEEMWADVYSKRGLLSQSQSRPHDALQDFEQALSHFPDHPEATVALSGLLLDIYEQIIPPEQPHLTPDTPLADHAPGKLPESLAGTAQTAYTLPTTSQIQTANPSPRDLSRLAARDRAYALLSSLTKLSTGWHSSEAWLTLARAYELSGQVDKAKESLWWTVELENSRPVRPWSEVGPGGLVL